MRTYELSIEAIGRFIKISEDVGVQYTYRDLVDAIVMFGEVVLYDEYGYQLDTFGDADIEEHTTFELGGNTTLH